MQKEHNHGGVLQAVGLNAPTGYWSAVCGKELDHGRNRGLHEAQRGERWVKRRGTSADQFAIGCGRDSSYPVAVFVQARGVYSSVGRGREQ